MGVGLLSLAVTKCMCVCNSVCVGVCVYMCVWGGGMWMRVCGMFDTL